MSKMTETELEETLKILYNEDRYLYDCLCIHLMELDKEIKRWRQSTKEYTDTLNQARRKRDSVKNKLSVALKTIKEYKQEVKRLENELTGYKISNRSLSTALDRLIREKEEDF
jgi:predicted  nucleic acid-binding Zn-ribbon protein